MQVDLDKYSEFVAAVTSNTSTSLTAFMDRCNELDGPGSAPINVPLLLTAGFGMGGEAGEFQEIIKKLFFHNKPLTEETITHLKKELGDIIWYWTNACRALYLDPNDVIAENVNKLEARYPGGKFDAYYSENRKAGDI